MASGWLKSISTGNVVNKIHLSITLILLIAGCWGMFLYLRSGEISLLSVETSPRMIYLLRPPKSELLKNDSLVVEFKGTLPNMGIVSIRFNNQNRINQDRLRFFIKSKNNNKWYYEGSYKTDQFQQEGLFPFGFPEIINSENEIFQINLISESGTPSSAVAISNKSPVITTRYVFNLERLKKNPILFVKFLWYKTGNILADPRVVGQMIVAFFPLIVYILVYRKIKNKLALLSLMSFSTLIYLPRIASKQIIDLVSAVAIISLVILTVPLILKTIHYNNGNH